ncbi:MATE family efflux transporter [Alicyclobacillus tolerans]|uniref:Probable multidrug resistance protein NorM n=1 Tax=Alicyclobacillus tolerans TaxID=90970 RepID=A0ABT9LZK7_9BACL|nr:MATE family efflux transporter [Alicyclobacillus tengchongensis]MDP9729692.1 putative MATE family efflux protein [Alicyclobacillus tengchongensis]
MKLFVASRRVFSIAWPAIGEAYLQNLLGVVDTFFIAKLGLVAIDAVGVTNVYSMTYIGVFIAISAALSVFLSRAIGANDIERGRSAVWHGLVIAVAIGFVLGVISVFFAAPLLHIMGAHGQLQQTAFPYYRTVLGLSPLIALFTAQSASFRATGDTKTPLRVGLEMNVVHVILDYVLIFGIGPIHGWGIAGAGWAMILARIYASVRLWAKSRRVEVLALSVKHLVFRKNLVVSMIKFAIPAAIERLSMRLGQVIYFGLIVRMGVDVYATHNIAGTVTTFASTVGGGFATAATATIGQAVGSGNESDALAYRRASYIQSAVFMTAVTAILCATSPWFGLLFTHNERVIHLLTIILGIDIVSQPFLAAVLVDTSAIQAGGNSRYPMIVTTIGIWGIRTLGVYVFAWKLGFGLPAVWACIAGDNALRALLFAWYRHKKNWIRALA